MVLNRKILKKLYAILHECIKKTLQTIVSIVRIIVLSRLSTAVKTSAYVNNKFSNNCCILGNGPSLKQALNNGEVILNDTDVFCVNLFAKCDDFWIIKPRFYFLVDPCFFEPMTERDTIIVDDLCKLLSKVDWNMYLCVSTNSNINGIISKINNQNIRSLSWNTATFEGFSNISYRIFSLNLGMPKCQTVVNFALMAAINMKYQNIYLYGADHSWTKDLRVDNNNNVCYGDRHVYNTKLTEIKMKYSISHLLNLYANMFASHLIISNYAKYKKITILNCTKDSFIDAYTRKI